MLKISTTGLAVSILVLGLTGCAAAPVAPTAELQAAEQAIATAERAKANAFAMAEMQEARAKMNAARLAVEREDMVLARRHAEIARADAELALAKTAEGKAQAVVVDMNKSIEMLKQEMLRKTEEIL